MAVDQGTPVNGARLSSDTLAASPVDAASPADAALIAASFSAALQPVQSDATLLARADVLRDPIVVTVMDASGARIRVTVPVQKDDNWNPFGGYHIVVGGTRYDISAWSPAAASGGQGQALVLDLLKRGVVTPANSNMQITEGYYKYENWLNRGQFWVPDPAKVQTFQEGVEYFHRARMADGGMSPNEGRERGLSGPALEGFKSAERGNNVANVMAGVQTVMDYLDFIPTRTRPTGSARNPLADPIRVPGVDAVRPPAGDAPGQTIPMKRNADGVYVPDFTAMEQRPATAIYDSRLTLSGETLTIRRRPDDSFSVVYRNPLNPGAADIEIPLAARDLPRASQEAAQKFGARQLPGLNGGPSVSVPGVNNTPASAAANAELIRVQNELREIRNDITTRENISRTGDGLQMTIVPIDNDSDFVLRRNQGRGGSRNPIAIEGSWTDAQTGVTKRVAIYLPTQLWGNPTGTLNFINNLMAGDGYPGVSLGTLRVTNQNLANSGLRLDNLRDAAADARANPGAGSSATSTPPTTVRNPLDPLSSRGTPTSNPFPLANSLPDGTAVGRTYTSTLNPLISYTVGSDGRAYINYNYGGRGRWEPLTDGQVLPEVDAFIRGERTRLGVTNPAPDATMPGTISTPNAPVLVSPRPFNSSTTPNGTPTLSDTQAIVKELSATIRLGAVNPETPIVFNEQTFNNLLTVEAGSRRPFAVMLADSNRMSAYNEAVGPWDFGVGIDYASESLNRVANQLNQLYEADGVLFIPVRKSGDELALLAIVDPNSPAQQRNPLIPETVPQDMVRLLNEDIAAFNASQLRPMPTATSAAAIIRPEDYANNFELQQRLTDIDTAGTVAFNQDNSQPFQRNAGIVVEFNNGVMQPGGQMFPGSIYQISDTQLLRDYRLNFGGAVFDVNAAYYDFLSTGQFTTNIVGSTAEGLVFGRPVIPSGSLGGTGTQPIFIPAENLTPLFGSDPVSALNEARLQTPIESVRRPLLEDGISVYNNPYGISRLNYIVDNARANGQIVGVETFGVNRGVLKAVNDTGVVQTSTGYVPVGHTGGARVVETMLRANDQALREVLGANYDNRGLAFTYVEQGKWHTNVYGSGVTQEQMNRVALRRNEIFSQNPVTLPVDGVERQVLVEGIAGYRLPVLGSIGGGVRADLGANPNRTAEQLRSFAWNDAREIQSRILNDRVDRATALSEAPRHDGIEYVIPEQPRLLPNYDYDADYSGYPGGGAYGEVRYKGETTTHMVAGLLANHGPGYNGLIVLTAPDNGGQTQRVVRFVESVFPNANVRLVIAPEDIAGAIAQDPSAAGYNAWRFDIIQGYREQGTPLQMYSPTATFAVGQAARSNPSLLSDISRAMISPSTADQRTAVDQYLARLDPDGRLGLTNPDIRKGIIFIRNDPRDAGDTRNMTPQLVEQLYSEMRAQGLTVIVAGDSLPGYTPPSGTIDMREFFREVREWSPQAYLFKSLADNGVVVQAGMMSAAMDFNFVASGGRIATIEFGPDQRLGYWTNAFGRDKYQTVPLGIQRPGEYYPTDWYNSADPTRNQLAPEALQLFREALDTQLQNRRSSIDQILLASGISDGSAGILPPAQPQDSASFFLNGQEYSFATGSEYRIPPLTADQAQRILDNYDQIQRTLENGQFSFTTGPDLDQLLADGRAGVGTENLNPNRPRTIEDLAAYDAATGYVTTAPGGPLSREEIQRRFPELFSTDTTPDSEGSVSFANGGDFRVPSLTTDDARRIVSNYDAIQDAIANGQFGVTQTSDLFGSPQSSSSGEQAIVLDPTNTLPLTLDQSGAVAPSDQPLAALSDAEQVQTSTDVPRITPADQQAARVLADAAQYLGWVSGIVSRIDPELGAQLNKAITLASTGSVLLKALSGDPAVSQGMFDDAAFALFNAAAAFSPEVAKLSPYVSTGRQAMDLIVALTTPQSVVSLGGQNFIRAGDGKFLAQGVSGFGTASSVASLGAGIAGLLGAPQGVVTALNGASILFQGISLIGSIGMTVPIIGWAVSVVSFVFGLFMSNREVWSKWQTIMNNVSVDGGMVDGQVAMDDQVRQKTSSKDRNRVEYIADAAQVPISGAQWTIRPETTLQADPNGTVVVQRGSAGRGGSWIDVRLPGGDGSVYRLYARGTDEDTGERVWAGSNNDDGYIRLTESQLTPQVEVPTGNYVLDLTVNFQPINPEVDGVSRTQSFTLSPEQVQALETQFGAGGGTIGAGDSRIASIQPFINQMGEISYRTDHTTANVFTYDDFNMDGVPDIVRQGILQGLRVRADNKFEVTLNEGWNAPMFSYTADSMEEAYQVGARVNVLMLYAASRPDLYDLYFSDPEAHAAGNVTLIYRHARDTGVLGKLDELIALAGPPQGATIDEQIQDMANRGMRIAALKSELGITVDPMHLNSYADMAQASGGNTLELLNQYIRSGNSEGRAVNAEGSVLKRWQPGANNWPTTVLLAYIASHLDLADAFGDNIEAARAHWNNNGRWEGRSVTFDVDGYLASRPDVRAAAVAALTAVPADAPYRLVGARDDDSYDVGDFRRARNIETPDGQRYTLRSRGTNDDGEQIWGGSDGDDGYISVTQSQLEQWSTPVAPSEDQIREFALRHYINTGRFEAAGVSPPAAAPAAPPPEPAPPALTDLGPQVSNRIIGVNESLVSANGRYRAVMQEDGNFVVYDGARAIWASGTDGDARGGYAAMQADGNFVVYRPGGRGEWSSRTSNGAANRNFTLAMQDDGNLVVYDSQGNRPVWASMGGRIAVPEANAPAAAPEPAPTASAPADAAPPPYRVVRADDGDGSDVDDFRQARNITVETPDGQRYTLRSRGMNDDGERIWGGSNNDDGWITLTESRLAR